MTPAQPGGAESIPSQTIPLEQVTLERWAGDVSPEDPNANFKHEIALYANASPLDTLRGLSEVVGLSIGVLAHFILARYASSGSAALLEIGPEMVTRLWQPIERAERKDTDDARLDAYRELRDLVSWLASADAGLPGQETIGLA